VIGMFWRGEERMLWRLVGTGTRRGRALPSRAGDVLRQPVTWVIFAGALSLTGPRGRRAVLRGITCSAVAAVVQFPFKLAFRRPRPLGARLLRTQRSTSSFPSGHTASDLSFMFGATQEIPLLIAPLSIATLGSHWSLMRSRIHYPSDIIAGGMIAVSVTGAA
jgi:membrane-associated phospholipid phosphatase